MDTRKINILGAEYTLSVCGEDEDSRLAECDGFCDETSKELVVDSYSKHVGDRTCKKNLQVQIKKNKRHEVIHAFLFESGLAENSEWAQNEEMVDFSLSSFPNLWKRSKTLTRFEGQ